MAQHDYSIANQSGSAFRADLNTALSAIVSQNSGTSSPATTFAHQMWADTTNNVMKLRNAANSGWIELYQLDGEWTDIAFENGTAAAPSIYFKDSGTDTGFYSPGANQVGISTGGTSALVVNASQRVGIGTTSPSSTLSVVNTTGDVALLESASTYGAVLELKATGTNGRSFKLQSTASGDLPNPGGALIIDDVTGGARRLAIDGNGAFSSYVGTAEFTVRKGTSSGTDTAFIVRQSASSNTTGSLAFRVMADGDAENLNNSYGGISDIKLKENIVDANSQWDDLKALQVRNYNFSIDTGYSTHTQIGLVAQEVELVSPGLVSESPDRDEDGNDLGTVTKSVNYSVLYMKAVKALQEAMERIEVLEAKVTALEGN
jgi:hypothetical protein